MKKAVYPGDFGKGHVVKFTEFQKSGKILELIGPDFRNTYTSLNFGRQIFSIDNIRLDNAP